jgi:hypothetical protein
MRKPSRTGGRLRIGRLDLDLRGIAPGTAEAAARALGPALSQALTQGSASAARGFGPGIEGSRFASADRIDAGRIDSPASPEPHDLAARIAQRIAHALEREER